MLKHTPRPDLFRFVLVFDAIDRQREAAPTLLPALARLSEIVCFFYILFQGKCRLTPMLILDPQPDDYLHRHRPPSQLPPDCTRPAPPFPQLHQVRIRRNPHGLAASHPHQHSPRRDCRAMDPLRRLRPRHPRPRRRPQPPVHPQRLRRALAALHSAHPRWHARSARVLEALCRCAYPLPRRPRPGPWHRCLFLLFRQYRPRNAGEARRCGPGDNDRPNSSPSYHGKNAPSSRLRRLPQRYTPRPHRLLYPAPRPAPARGGSFRVGNSGPARRRPE